MMGGIPVRNESSISTCRIDRNGNILILKKIGKYELPEKPAFCTSPNKVADFSYGDYYCRDTTEYGGIIQNPCGVGCAKIYNVRGDGLIMQTNDCTLSHGVISHASGTALIIKGSNNTVADLVIHKCGKPVEFEGSNNLVVCSIYDGPDKAGTSVEVEVRQNPDGRAGATYELPNSAPSSSEVRGRVLQENRRRELRTP